MAEELKIKVDFSDNLSKTKGHVKELESEGAFKGDGKSLGNVKNIIQELDALVKISNPTAKHIKRIEALFNELTEVLVKASSRVKVTSDEFKNLEKTLKEQEKNRKSLTDERSKILKQGRINKETNKYSLFKTTQNEIISGANLTNGKTKQPIKTAEVTAEPTPTPNTNIIPNCTEAGKDDEGNNVCKVCASGYTLENNQCVKNPDSE